MKISMAIAAKYCPLVLAGLMLAGCATVTLVQPYDADLYANTEAFYKQAARVIARGVSASPRTSGDVRSIADGAEAQHPGHYRQFRADYDTLLIESNALILRSMANATRIGAAGQQLHDKIEAAITESFPSECDSLQASFAEVSLTTRNYIDLKCLIGKWSEQHQNPDLTNGKRILKQSNWEGRAKSLFQGILAIQSAQAAKQKGE